MLQMFLLPEIKTWAITSKHKYLCCLTSFAKSGCSPFAFAALFEFLHFLDNLI